MDGGFDGGTDRRSRMMSLLRRARGRQEPKEAEAMATTASEQATMRRAPAVVVSGRGRLTVQGDLNIIAKQVIVNRAPRGRAQVTTPWRTVTIAAILARCANDLGDAHFYASFVREQFGKDRLADLADAELQRVRQYVFEAPLR